MLPQHLGRYAAPNELHQVPARGPAPRPTGGMMWGHGRAPPHNSAQRTWFARSSVGAHPWQCSAILSGRARVVPQHRLDLRLRQLPVGSRCCWPRSPLPATALPIEVNARWLQLLWLAIVWRGCLAPRFIDASRLATRSVPSFRVTGGAARPWLFAVLCMQVGISSLRSRHHPPGPGLWPVPS